jgi:hypothetical protein
MEITLKIVGASLMAAVAVVQFFTSVLAWPPTRFMVLVAAILAVACFAAEQVLGSRREKRERLEWINGQAERDRKLVTLFAAQVKGDGLVAAPSRPDLPAAPTLPLLSAEEEPGMSADDPRVYVTTIREPTEGMFLRTPFVLTNNGKDVAHKVEIHMPKPRGMNVSFEIIEVLAAGNAQESLPTIDSDDVMRKHDIFHWMMEGWNGDSRGIIQDWPQPLTVCYEDFRHRKFEVSMVLMFYPIKYMLKQNHSFKTWREYKTWEFKDVTFKRVS